jgi:hypothetical protein
LSGVDAGFNNVFLDIITGFDILSSKLKKSSVDTVLSALITKSGCVSISLGSAEATIVLWVVATDCIGSGATCSAISSTFAGVIFE